MLQGGFGSAVLEFAMTIIIKQCAIERMGIPDEFIEHGNVDQLLEEITLQQKKR